MGLAAKIMMGVTGHPSMVAEMRKHACALEQEQDVWIAGLRAAGVKAAHPADGWVNREHNFVQLVYPQFNDGAVAGDLVALGSPQWGIEECCHRIVRLKEFRQGLFGSGSWKFEPSDAF